jgi:hypothetical protein
MRDGAPAFTVADAGIFACCPRTLIPNATAAPRNKPQLCFLVILSTYDVPVTVSVAVLLVMLPDRAVMFVVSLLLGLSAVASPELSIVAAAVFEDVHVTELVRSTVVLF